jgi:tRNA U55 pseudouridine synthase TruB
MELSGVVTLCKPCGMTPLEALQEYVALTGGSSDVRRSYAGRLDPMAEGLLLVLEGDRCDEQEAWQNHEKKYDWELLLGLSSDSFDVLGLGECSTAVPTMRDVEEAVRLLEHETEGPRLQEYPPYSSIRVRGHPLFWWAQQGRLQEVWSVFSFCFFFKSHRKQVVIPRIPVTVHSCRVGATRWIHADALLQDMIARISSVSGTGFRQIASIQRWRDVMAPLVAQHVKLPVISVSCSVSSGTYIRCLAKETGSKVGSCGLAWRICRTSVGGEWSLLNADANLARFGVY